MLFRVRRLVESTFSSRMVTLVASDGDKPIGLLARCLGGIVGFGARRPRLALWLMVFVGCAAVGVAVSELKLLPGRANLLAPDKAQADYVESFGGGSELVVVVQHETADTAVIQKVLDELGERLQREPEYFRDVLFRIDQSRLRRKALQYLTDAQLQSAIRRVDNFAPVFAKREWDLLRVERLAKHLDTQVTAANSGQALSPSTVANADRLAKSLDGFLVVDGEDIRLNSQGFQSPWPDIVSMEVERSAQDADLAYLMNSTGQLGMLRVHPAEHEDRQHAVDECVHRLRQHIAELEAEYAELAPGVSLALTGIPVLEHDELYRSGKDMINAALIAFFAVGLLLSFGLRGMRHPMLVLIMMINALAITFGIAAVAVGHLNILSICFVAIVIGLGVDFGIHFVTRYLFLRQELYEMDESLVLAGQSVGTGIMTSALTTAIAFGSAALTGYPGLAELGIISAGGILVSALLTFTFLPALIALADEKVEVDELPVPVSGDFWRSAVTGFPLVAICLAGIGVVSIAWNAFNYEDGQLSFKLKYDTNLLNLQDQSLDSVQAERVLAATDESLLYAVSIANSREEADKRRAAFLALPTVDRVTDLSSRLPKAPTANQAKLIEQLGSKLRGIDAGAPDMAASNAEMVGNTLDALYKALSQSPDRDARAAASTLDHFLNNLVGLSKQQRAAVIDAYQNLTVTSLLKEFKQVEQATSLEPISYEDLPEAWRNRYVRSDADSQLWLLRIYPKDDIWKADTLAAFVRDVRAVDSEAKGAPIQNYDSAARMHECYQTIAVYSLAAIALFLLVDFLRPGQKLLTMVPPMVVVGVIGYAAVQRGKTINVNLLIGLYMGMVAFIASVFDFRNLRDTLIALIPPVAAGAMLLGLMALLDINFNPINLIALPLVLGIGVDDGVHMVHDYRRQLMGGAEEYKPSGDTLNGVLLTSLTSIIGFGALMISAHAGLKSVGIVLAVGIACSLAAAVILVPPILVLVARHQPASFEPVVLRQPKEPSEDGSEDGGDQRRLSRKERRRQQQAA